MDWEQRCIRVCAAMVAAAIAIRLWAGGALLPLGRVLASDEAASFLVYLHTGRVVRMVPEEPEPVPQPTQAEPAPVSFSAQDAEALSIDDECGLEPDLQALLTEPLDWDLRGEGPRVLILHTHTTESYAQTADRYEETSPYRTLEPDHNMLALGGLLTDILTEAGIGVIHDTAFHDYPSYNGSYAHAAASTKELLDRYPTIELVLDLHRDAADTPTGQLVTRCSVGGQRSAQLMFVLGTDARLKHPDWERNLSLALKLQVLLEREDPGICRKLTLSKNRYNQHLGDRALLIEIGAAGNTLDEARIAAQKLGEAIVKLADGA